MNGAYVTIVEKRIFQPFIQSIASTGSVSLDSRSAVGASDRHAWSSLTDVRHRAPLV